VNSLVSDLLYTLDARAQDINEIRLQDEDNEGESFEVSDILDGSTILHYSMSHVHNDLTCSMWVPMLMYYLIEVKQLPVSVAA